MFLLTAGSGSLELDDPDAGYVIQSVTLGAPDTRDVSSSRPDADGTSDTTKYVGARPITVNLEIVSDPSTKQELLDRLAPFLHPRTRIDLTIVTEPDGPARRIQMRPDQFAAPFERPWHVATTLGFKTVGPPFFQSVDVKTVTFAPGTGTAVGFVFPITFPLSVAASVSSAVIANNAGDQPAQWSMRIDGPVTGPRIRNETLGLELSFPSLSIASGSYVIVSSADRTVLANGVTSRYSTLDFLHSSWWLLEPGANAITMPTASSDTPAQGQISFHDTYLM